VATTEQQISAAQRVVVAVLSSTARSMSSFGEAPALEIDRTCMHTKCIWKLEWDADKAVANSKKHGVRFEEAATALLDPRALAQEDADSEGEARWVLIGMSTNARLLTVVYTLRDETRIRLISARKATRKEAGYYA